MRFGVMHNFRNSAASALTFPQFYRRCLDQIALADDLGYDHVWITEHHFVDDGYMPSPLVMAAAIATATTKIAIGQDVMLVPFLNPVRLAEDLAVLDNLSNGRMMLGAGMGYVPSEFAGMGIPRRERRARMDDALAILRLAWTEDEFSYRGEHFVVENVRVRPRPVQSGGPPIWVAAMAAAGAQRAARFGTHLLPQGDRAAVLDPYLDARRRAGHDPATARVGIMRPFLVNDDPLAAHATSHGAVVARIAAGAAATTASMKVYEKWFGELSPDDPMVRQLVEGDAANRLVPQDAFIGSAAACIAELERMATEFAITDVIISGMSDGPSTKTTDDNITRFAREVIPHFL